MIMNMMTNAISIPEVRNRNGSMSRDYVNHPLGSLLEEMIDERFGDTLDEKQLLILTRRVIRRVARKLNINFSETQRHATLMKELEIQSVSVLQADQFLPELNGLHESAFTTSSHGSDSDKRNVRAPNYQRSDNKDMNQRGKEGVHTSNLDSGLHLEDRHLCGCGTTFALGSKVCRECGTVLDKEQHKTIKRPTTKNHTRNGNHFTLSVNETGHPVFTISRVEFSKGGVPRTKAGSHTRSNAWTTGRWATVLIEGDWVESRFGAMMHPVQVLVTVQGEGWVSGGDE